MILSTSNDQINKTIAAPAHPLCLKDLGDMTKSLGININSGVDSISFDQEDKIDAICKNLGMNHCGGAKQSSIAPQLAHYFTSPT